MASRSQRKSPIGKVVARWVVTAALPFLFTATVRAQDAPLISGAAGFISTTSGGATFFQPVIAPVADIPLGDKFLFEARADLCGFIVRQNFTSGPYEGQFFATMDYAQLDYLANKHLTLTVGRFLTPFNTYNERLTAIWIRNLPDVPLIYTIGTRTAGSSDGVMARGVAASSSSVEWNYAAYFSANSTISQIPSGRAAGFRSGLFFPHQQLEIGGSYQRFLQDTHMNIGGFYAWWVPTDVPVQVRSEFADSRQGHGYWVEGTFRFTRKNQLTNFASRVQPLVRVQQFFRGSLPGGSLPLADTNAADVGLNVLLPQDVRLSSSYSRQFSSTGDFNVWNVALTYRFMLPLAGRQ
ncbi:MAG TPA: hypothetical protein VF786_00300 [Terriglobales bacterium]